MIILIYFKHLFQFLVFVLLAADISITQQNIEIFFFIFLLFFISKLLSKIEPWILTKFRVLKVLVEQTGLFHQTIKFSSYMYMKCQKITNKQKNILPKDILFKPNLSRKSVQLIKDNVCIYLLLLENNPQNESI